MELKGIIFDLDGTLGDSMPVLCEAFRRVFEKFLGRRYNDGEITALFGAAEEGIFRRLVPDRWQDCLQEYYRQYEGLHAGLGGAFPGIEKALTLLRQRGVSLAVATGKGAHTTDISLRDFGLEDYFDAVETGSPRGAVKPFLITRLLERWAVPPGRVAYVGDTAYDMEAAREAGVIPLGAGWAPTADRAALRAAAPHAAFDTVGDFVGWLDRNVEAAPL
jgi:pyrophosphatase PpaX